MFRASPFVPIVLLLLSSVAAAQSYPDRPVKVLIGFPPGGVTDTLLRRIATRLEVQLGTAVVVENRPGASGTIAAAAVARAKPDGYTLLFGVAANLVIAPATMKHAPYDPATAFTPVVEVARGPYVFLVRSDAPARNMPEFIAWAKANPGKLNYASPGTGSAHHLATELIKRTTAIDLVHVPYTGGMYVALLSKQVDAMLESMPGPLPHLATGKLRALAVTGARRLTALPDVPTLSEQGLPNVDVNSWWGFVGPAGMPTAVVARLNSEVALALADSETKAALAAMSIEAAPGTPEAFGAYIRQENTRWKEFVAHSGLALE